MLGSSAVILRVTPLITSSPVLRNSHSNSSHSHKVMASRYSFVRSVKSWIIIVFKYCLASDGSRSQKSICQKNIQKIPKDAKTPRLCKVKE